MANESRPRPRRRLSEEGAGVWTDQEHSRFLEAMELYPKGPWKLVSDYVGSRNPRQTMTHAQKYRQKLERHHRGLRTKRKDAAEFASAHGIVPKQLAEAAIENTAPLPLEYGSPKDVSNEVWVGPMEALLQQSMGFAHAAADASWNPTMASDGLDTLLPLSDLETQHSTYLVDVQPVLFDDCLDYFIESFS